MKKRNPIRYTVANFVAATGRSRRKSKRSKFAKFFWDLENRGPFTSNSIYGQWTVEIRKDLQREGKWAGDDCECDLTFVAEYLLRLQQKFWGVIPDLRYDLFHALMGINSRPRTMPPYRTAKMIYKKIRIWGLRLKQFELSKWESDVSLLFCFVYLYEDKDRSFDGKLIYRIHPEEVKRV